MNDAHSHRPTTPQQAGVDPLLVEVTRGNAVESRHRAAIAVSDAAGRIVAHWGDIERPVYARSSLKPLQALPLIETGAAERFGLGDAEIALACASHSAEERHVETVRAWLEKIGLAEGDLECGPQLPYHDAAALRRIVAGESEAAIYNNCSGKHTGFLATAVHKGEKTKGYIGLGHPVQQRILGTLEQMTGLDLGRAPKGIDGCGIPVIGMPLGHTAMAMARLADPAALPDHRATAARRIVAAMIAEPFMVGGSGRFGTRLMTALGDRAALKGGAEGFYIAILPQHGLGVAIKCDDGAGRAAEVAMGMTLCQLGIIGEDEQTALADLLSPPVINRAGLEVGRVRRAAESPF
ncbi:MAG: asparaginase [Dongiaceae bacterium]